MYTDSNQYLYDAYCLAARQVEAKVIFDFSAVRVLIFSQT